MRDRAMRAAVLIVATACFGTSRQADAQQPTQASASVQAAAPTQDSEPYVLHVYTNLIQLPTLVLNGDLKPVPAVPKNQFNLSIDSGPTFHPTSLRREGNDPISLAILIDASGDQDELLKVFAESLSMLAPQDLHPQDHVTIYALDCKLIRSLDNVPADPASLKRGVEAALQAPGLHGSKRSGACSRKLALRNALGLAVQALADVPGRRVLLAITDGHDGSSSLGWAQVEQYAAGKGVAVFG